MKAYFVEFLLIVVIPAATVGFNMLENTPLYEFVFHFKGVSHSIERKLLSKQSRTEERSSIRAEDEEFDNVWSLVKRNTSADLPNGRPKFIMRLAMQNASYVEVPSGTTSRRVYLVPESIPVAAGFCSLAELGEGCSPEEVIIIGTVGDLRRWLRESRNRTRLRIDVLLAMFSIVAGAYVHIRKESRMKST